MGGETQPLQSLRSSIGDDEETGPPVPGTDQVIPSGLQDADTPGHKGHKAQKEIKSVKLQSG